MKAIIMTIPAEKFKLKDHILNCQKRCTDSLEAHGIEYELLYGPTSVEDNDLWCEELGMPLFKWEEYSKTLQKHYSNWATRTGDVGCIMSFVKAFQMVVDANEPYLIFEYDGYLVKPIDFDVEDGKYYRLHNIPHGHCQIVTPKAAQILIDSKRHTGHHDWFKCYDTHIKNWHRDILEVRHGYGDGNEHEGYEICMRNTDNQVGQ